MTSVKSPVVLYSGRDIREWLRKVDDPTLIVAVHVLTTDGVKPVPGRMRPTGRRSRSKLEPYILGAALGDGTSPRHGGAPSNQVLYIPFIGSLVHAWEIATGTFPEPDRGDKTAFGDLVHHIFAWIGIGSAGEALRQYWQAIERENDCDSRSEK